MVVFTVPANLKGYLVEDGAAGQKATCKGFVTRRESVFSEHEVLVDPRGRAGDCSCWPEAATNGGHYARSGFLGFRRQGVKAVLLVPSDKVTQREIPS